MSVDPASGASRAARPTAGPVAAPGHAPAAGSTPAAGPAAAAGPSGLHRAAEDEPEPRPDVSVVLPVYNEVGHLEAELARIREALAASDYTFEIVTVDDGSTDGSRELLARLAADDPHLRVIEHRRNLGSGGARRTGTRAALGEVVVWTDVDMTYPNDTIPDLVDALDGHDQVVGARTSEQGTKKMARVPAKWAIRRLAEYLSNEEISDLNSGFRAFKRDLAMPYLHRLPNGFSCVTTITMSFLADGLSVGYVEIPYLARQGESKFHWYRDTKLYLLQVIRMILSYNPLRVFLPIGTLLLLFGLGKLGFDLVTKDLRLATNTLLILFAAFQVISIGLLADLVVRATKQPVDDPLRR